MNRAAAGLFVWMLGCSSPSDDAASPNTYANRDELLDPLTCAGCHPRHYQEWSGSMHAYAADDPIFVAMNRRGQAEAAVGPFCVNCHAPMAVRSGATVDGLNLAELPAKLKGVTCYFCHSVDDVQGTHDNPLHLATDDVLRGGLRDAAPNSVHRSGYSPFADRDRAESSRMCGACHDIVNGHGLDLERTFAEFRASAFAQPDLGTTCGQCHMDQSKSLEVAGPGGTPRRLHSHQFPGVDLALTPFPEIDAQRTAVQRSLDTTLQSALCVRGLGAGSTLDVILDNVAAGHGWPSGAAQDRRAWVELTAYSEGAVIYQSGAVPAQSSPTELSDPDLWLLRDCLFDRQGARVHMFWEAESYESRALPGQVTFDPSDPRFYQTHVRKIYPGGGALLPSRPDRVTLRVNLQPVGLDVIDDLARTNYLSSDEARDLRARMVTLSVGQELEWTSTSATESYLDQGIPVSCVSKTNLLGAASTVRASTSTKCP